MKNVLFFLSVILLASCSKEKLAQINESANQTNETGKLNAGGDGADNKYDLLGYGYDATGVLCNPGNFRARVIDVVALNTGIPGAITEDSSTIQFGEFISAANADIFISKLNAKYNTNGTYKLFTGEVTGGASSNVMVSSTSGHAVFYWYLINGRLSMNELSETYMQYLASDFKSDLLKLTANEIVLKYGTHILTNIELGGSLHVRYNNDSKALNDESSVENSAKVGLDKIFNLGVSAGISSSGLNYTGNETFAYETIGGQKSHSLKGTVALPTASPSVDISGWQSSCSRSYMSMIRITPNTLIPIYDLVSDPAKKAAIKAAVEKYIEDRQFTLLAALYRYYNGLDHYYTTEYADYRSYGYNYEQIAGYVFPSASSCSLAVPLYRYYNGHEHFYTTTYANYIGYTYNYEQIAGYVLSSPTGFPGAVPFYRYYNGHEHFYTTTYANYTSYTYNYEQIACYLPTF